MRVPADVPVVDGHRLSWRKSPDDRSQLPEHAVSLAVVAPVEKMWRAPVVRVNQGAEGSCTAFSTTNELMAWPAPVKLGDPNGWGHRFFHVVKENDEWQGEDYDWSSVNGAMKAGRALGWYTGWKWGRTIEDCRSSVIQTGPMVFGIPWLDGMFHPRPSGLVEVSGSVAGGHAICCTGYTPRAQGDFAKLEGHIEVFRFRNSWGRGWGRTGDFFVKPDDLGRLLVDGEAAAPVGRSVTGKTPA